MTTESNYFSELAKINVNEHVEKKGKFSYLSWPYAVDVLRKNHPNATWEVKRFGPDQLPYLKTDVGYFVEVPVSVNGITLSQLHPVLDNNNRPIEKPNSFQINTSLQRALVKSIALHGLGLYIYAGEDLPESDDDVATSSSARDNAIIRAREAQKQKAISDDLPFQSDTAQSASDNDAGRNEAEYNGEPPITDQQKKAIANMLNVLTKRKPDVDKDAFLNDQVAKCGVSSVDDLKFAQVDGIIKNINQAMRA